MDISAAESSAVSPKRLYVCTNTIASNKPKPKETENDDNGMRIARSSAASTVALPRMRRVARPNPW